MNKFFVDGKSYETDQTALIGGDIKKIANGSMNYFLMVENDGVADQHISDGQAIRLDGEVRHFWIVPPCTI